METKGLVKEEARADSDRGQRDFLLARVFRVETGGNEGHRVIGCFRNHLPPEDLGVRVRRMVLNPRAFPELAPAVVVEGDNSFFKDIAHIDEGREVFNLSGNAVQTCSDIARFEQRRFAFPRFLCPSSRKLDFFSESVAPIVITFDLHLQGDEVLSFLRTICVGHLFLRLIELRETSTTRVLSNRNIQYFIKNANKSSEHSLGCPEIR